jgi:hypothetical protein
MVFVSRNSQQKIIALYSDSGDNHNEEMSVNSEEVMGFLRNLENTTPNYLDLLQSDLEFIRVIDDLIEVLLKKNIITITDFPKPVLAKMMTRKGIRDQLSPFTDIIHTDKT